MKVTSGFLMLALAAGAATANAQRPPQPPTPPAKATRPADPAPTAMPAPTPRPARVIQPGDLDYDMYYKRAMDAIDSKAFQRFDELKNLNLDLKNDLKFDYKIDASAMVNAQERIKEATQLAQERSADFMRLNQDRIAEAQRLSADRVAEARRFNDEAMREGLRIAQQVAPMAKLNVDAAVRAAQDFQYRYDYPSPQGLAPLAPRWQQDWSQERDAADSMFNSGRDALNRGDWRRSADIFAQVYSKYPKSIRIPSAAYYEAFSRYRIGSTDELKAALKVLTERGQSSNNSSYNGNEVTSLATRIRGALAQRGDPDALRQLQTDAQKGKTCDSEDMQVRSEALSALAQSDPVSATPMLRRVLEKKDPCTLELRRRALSILLRRADTAATSAAILVAKNTDETIDLRTDAIQYLSRLPGDNALAALEELMRTSTDRDVQRASVRSLSNSENQRARQSLRALVERSDVSETLRAEALSTFEHDRTGAPEDAAWLRSLYPKLQVDRLKIAVIAAVSKTPGTENEQFVMGIARNQGESSEIRANAISRMYRLPNISIADIGKLYDVADSRQMRDQIISVLSQRKEPETIDKLGEIAKNSTDPSTRRSAINALTRKDDPKAKKILADLVGADR